MPAGSNGSRAALDATPGGSNASRGALDATPVGSKDQRGGLDPAVIVSSPPPPSVDLTATPVGTYAGGALAAGFLRSLARLPPTSSYSVASSPNSALTPPRMRLALAANAEMLKSFAPRLG